MADQPEPMTEERLCVCETHGSRAMIKELCREVRRATEHEVELGYINARQFDRCARLEAEAASMREMMTFTGFWNAKPDGTPECPACGNPPDKHAEPCHWSGALSGTAGKQLLKWVKEVYEITSEIEDLKMRPLWFELAPSWLKELCDADHAKTT